MKLNGGAKAELSQATPQALKIFERASGGEDLEIQFVDMGRYAYRDSGSTSTFYEALGEAANHLTAFKGKVTVTVCGKFKRETVLFEASKLQSLFGNLQISFSSFFFDKAFSETARALLDRGVGVQAMFDLQSVGRKLFIKINETRFEYETVSQRCIDLHRKLPLQFHFASINQQGTTQPDEIILSTIDHLAWKNRCSVAYSGGLELSLDNAQLSRSYPNIRKFFIGNSIVRLVSIAKS